MNRRKFIGVIAFCLLLAFGWISQTVPSLLQDNWAMGWKIAFVIAVYAAFLATFYDREDLPQKLWDFNPRRGLLYVFLGWFIFPFMIGIKAASGADFTIGGMVLITLGLSAAIGIVGTFTENVGI